MEIQWYLQKTVLVEHTQFTSQQLKDVLEGKGNMARGNSTELVIEAQLCAALTEVLQQNLKIMIMKVLTIRIAIQTSIQDSSTIIHLTDLHMASVMMM